jgi:hypothetical protein
VLVMCRTTGSALTSPTIHQPVSFTELARNQRHLKHSQTTTRQLNIAMYKQA